MADFSKLKNKKNRFGEVIPKTEASANLEAPEHAPKKATKPVVKKSRAKTGRTKPFSTRVSEEFEKEFKLIAFQKGLKKVELLEDMLRVYKEQ